MKLSNKPMSFSKISLAEEFKVNPEFLKRGRFEWRLPFFKQAI